MDSLKLSDRPQLTTERLSLRCPDRRDIDAIVTVVGDWEVARRLARVPHPYGPADAMFFLEQVVANEWVWAITLRGSDTLIGAVGLTPEDAETAELGYWLSPKHWGHGYMTEAAGAVLSFGRDTLRLPRITSAYFAANPGSGRVLEKLGFVETSHAPRSRLASGEDVPSVEMVLATRPPA